MSVKSFDLAGLAEYLNRDARELEKLAAQGKLPGRRVAGRWRFERQDIDDWLERRLADCSDSELKDVERSLEGAAASSAEPGAIVSLLVSPETIEIPLAARTAPGVLQRLVEVANRTWQVYSPEEVLVAVRNRESLGTTALPGGVAIPHPRRPMPHAFGESIIAFGRTSTGIPFGGNRGQLTDLFFLVLCRDSQTHLHVLARLSRMFQREGCLSGLRESADPADAYARICDVEAAVLG
jgi:PTS system nitrogen regulatory IIA component